MKQERAAAASGPSGGGDAIKPAIGKKAARKGSETAASGSSGGGGGGGAAVIKSQKLAEGDKAGAGKAKKRMGLVSQKYIDRLLEEEATGGPRVPNFDFLDKCAGSDDPILRALAARTAACMEKFRAHNAEILRQYREQGHAYAEMEEEPFDIEKLWIVKATRKTLLASS